MQRVPVLSINNKPLMPSKPSRARRWIKEGKAIGKWSKLNVYYVQLLVEAENITQDIAVGIDPGKMFTGIAVLSQKYTLLTAHVELPFKNVTKRMLQRAMMRRSRRGRRINRKVPYSKRSHRQARFNNRRQLGMPPSIKTNKNLELRLLYLIVKLYPVTNVIYEVVKAKGNKGFSPVMVGQKLMCEKLKNASKLFNFKTLEGYQTSVTRKHLGLEKKKGNKSLKIPQTHAVDGIALAASHWLSYGIIDKNTMAWKGKLNLTDSLFLIISRPPISRRQLHLMVPAKGGKRRKYGGTVTRHGFRKGDYVKAIQGDKTFFGWISGDTERLVSVSDSHWNRLGQCSPKKVQLLKRSTGLIITSEKYKVQGG
ncbi:RRXRR domain-containing protein [Plectonema cf. radiosum LEGE 06105]|uniref:RRXRR domain-containing protein n=1 Tax=Plectonema cf. radiosum LEGE 06105 TaxID=945769 RepID=A0A8J7F8S9_9CYAN|nr:RRXRR domain-containing protein [Plectonema radiosum]MBE9211553.1 RRXRR domain-containing protein [Plectonema cf. radiosum LEGE 06105]